MTDVNPSLAPGVTGFWTYQQAPPDHGRIRAVAEDVGVPVVGWQLVDAGWTGGAEPTQAPRWGSPSTADTEPSRRIGPVR